MSLPEWRKPSSDPLYIDPDDIDPKTGLGMNHETACKLNGIKPWFWLGYKSKYVPKDPAQRSLSDY